MIQAKESVDFGIVLLFGYQMKAEREHVTENAVQKKTPPEYSDGFWGRVERLDHRIFYFLYDRVRNRVFDVLMPFLSIVANRGAIQIILSLILIPLSFHTDNFKMRLAAYCMIASAVIAGALAEMTIKRYWKRKRPFLVLEGVTARVPAKRLAKRPSFPSGHSAGYMGSVVALSMVYPDLAAFLIPLGLLGSYSRVYNGVHFPSDVLVGIITGAVVGLAVTVKMIPWLS